MTQNVYLPWAIAHGKEKVERDKVELLEFLDYFVKQWFETEPSRYEKL